MILAALLVELACSLGAGDIQKFMTYGFVGGGGVATDCPTDSWFPLGLQLSPLFHMPCPEPFEFASNPEGTSKAVCGWEALCFVQSLGASARMKMPALK